MPPRKPAIDKKSQGVFSLGENVLSPDSNVETQSRHMALVHILTPEFHGFDPADFADIPEEVVSHAAAFQLKPSLYWKYIPKYKRQDPETPSFSYETAEGGIMSVALTPEEYSTASESVEKISSTYAEQLISKKRRQVAKVYG